jgi:hypothetical protein
LRRIRVIYWGVVVPSSGAQKLVRRGKKVERQEEREKRKAQKKERKKADKKEKKEQAKQVRVERTTVRHTAGCGGSVGTGCLLQCWVWGECGHRVSIAGPGC